MCRCLCSKPSVAQSHHSRRCWTIASSRDRSSPCAVSGESQTCRVRDRRRADPIHHQTSHSSPQQTNNAPAEPDRSEFRGMAVRNRTDRTLRKLKTGEPMLFHSTSSDRSLHSYWGRPSLWMAVVHRDRRSSWCRREAPSIRYCRVYYSRHRESSVVRTHSQPGRRHCNCRRFEPRCFVSAPRPSRRIPYNPAVVVAAEAEEENSSPCCWSGTRDLRREFQPADSTNNWGLCSCFR